MPHKYARKFKNYMCANLVTQETGVFSHILGCQTREYIFYS